MLTCESVLNIDSLVHNKDGLRYGPSDGGFFDNPEVLQSAFQSPIDIYLINTKCANVTDVEKPSPLLPSFKEIIKLTRDRSPLAVLFARRHLDSQPT